MLDLSWRNKDYIDDENIECENIDDENIECDGDDNIIETSILEPGVISLTDVNLLTYKYNIPKKYGVVKEIALVISDDITFLSISHKKYLYNSIVRLKKNYSAINELSLLNALTNEYINDSFITEFNGHTYIPILSFRYHLYNNVIGLPVYAEDISVNIINEIDLKYLNFKLCVKYQVVSPIIHNYLVRYNSIQYNYLYYKYL